MGLTLAAVGVASGVVQGFLIRPAVDRFGERAALIAGLLFGAAGFAIYGLATDQRRLLGRHSRDGAVGHGRRRLHGAS